MVSDNVLAFVSINSNESIISLLAVSPFVSSCLHNLDTSALSMRVSLVRISLVLSSTAGAE